MSTKHLKAATRLIQRARRRLGPRARCLRLLHHLGILDLCLRILQSRLDHFLLILGYHRILDPQDIGEMDPGVISCTPHELERHLRLLQRYLIPITFTALAAQEDRRGKIPGKHVVITFDDGYLDNYLNAYPCLQKAGCPATIFLATDYLDHDRLYWWDLVAYMLHHRPDAVAEQAQYLPGIAPLPPTPANLRLYLEVLKRVPNAQREAFVAVLEEVRRASCPPAPRQALNWDQAREMGRHGIEYGGHTLTHPVLSQLEPNRLAAEVAGCRQRIQEEIGQPVLAFAYPVGNEQAFNPLVVQAVREAGYRYAASYIQGGNPVARLDRFALRRIHVHSAGNEALVGLKVDLLRRALPGG